MSQYAELIRKAAAERRSRIERGRNDAAASGWITVNGNHIPIDSSGNAIGGQMKAIGGGGSSGKSKSASRSKPKKSSKPFDLATSTQKAAVKELRSAPTGSTFTTKGYGGRPGRTFKKTESGDWVAEDNGVQTSSESLADLRKTGTYKPAGGARQTESPQQASEREARNKKAKEQSEMRERWKHSAVSPQGSKRGPQ